MQVDHQNSPIENIQRNAGNYLSAAELADELGVTKVSIWRWTKSGLLPKPIKLGSVIRYRRSEVDAYLDATRCNDQRLAG